MRLAKYQNPAGGIIFVWCTEEEIHLLPNPHCTQQISHHSWLVEIANNPTSRAALALRGIQYEEVYEKNR